MPTVPSLPPPSPLMLEAPKLRPTRLAVLAVLAVMAVTLSRAATFFIPIFSSDEAYIAVQGQVLAEGGRLYRDVADRKPPLVPYLYAIVFRLRGFADLIAVHILAILFITATALLLAYEMARRFSFEAGCFATGTFIAATASYLPAETQAANFEIFMLLPICLAMICARRRTPWALFASGIFVGVATLCKQTAAMTLVAVSFSAVFNSRRLRSLIPIGAGFTLAISVATLAVDPHDLYFWSVGGNAGYLFSGGVLGYALTRFLLITGTIMLSNLALCWLLARSIRNFDRTELDLWVWLASSAVAVAAGLRFFGHYYLQMLPPAALIAARQASHLTGRQKRLLGMGLAVPACIFVIISFYSAEIHKMPKYEAISSYVKKHTEAHDRIAIWGHFPEVYWASGRMPAMRFVHTGFLTGASGGRPPGPQTERGAMPGAWAMLFEDLERTPPRLFIDTSPASVRDYQYYPISRYPKLQQYLTAHYHRSATVDHVAIYERID